MTAKYLLFLAAFGSSVPLAPGQQSPSAAGVDRGRDVANATAGVNSAGVPTEMRQTLRQEGQVPPSDDAMDDGFGRQVVLFRRATWEPWNAKLDVGGFFTSNVALAEEGEVEDFFLKSSLQVSYTPQIVGNLFASFSVGDQIFRYSDNSDLDFDLFSADAGLLYATPHSFTSDPTKPRPLWDIAFSDTNVWLKYSYYRIAEPWGFAAFSFENQSLILGAQKNWKISRGLALFGGAMAEWSMDANDDRPRRDEYSAWVGARMDWTSRLSSTLTYRAGLYDYYEELMTIDLKTLQATGTKARRDFNQTIALSTEYKIKDWLRTWASVSATFNNSNIENLDYSVLNAGVAVGFTISW